MKCQIISNFQMNIENDTDEEAENYGDMLVEVFQDNENEFF